MTNRSCRCSNLCFSTIRLKVCMVWSCVDSILCNRRINSLSLSLILTIPGCPSCASVRTQDLNLLGVTILVPRRIRFLFWLLIASTFTLLASALRRKMISTTTWRAGFSFRGAFRVSSKMSCVAASITCFVSRLTRCLLPFMIMLVFAWTKLIQR